MAARACCHAVVGELPTVDILMASLTLFPRAFEIHIDQAGGGVRRLVAAITFHRFMRTVEWEGSLEVIETGQVAPHSCRMTNTTADRNAFVFKPLCHRIKTSMVRVGVTTRATQVSPLILRRLFRVDLD